MDHQSKVQFKFKWHSEGMAEVKEIACECGYKYTRELGETGLTVVDEDLWSCPQCNHEIQFLWQGMGWRNHVPFNEKHANIEELLFREKVKKKIEEKVKEAIKAPMHHIHKLEKELEHKKKVQS